MPPLFTSFDDAWRWFVDGGELEPLAERRERLVAGRAQFLTFQAPVDYAAVLAAADDILDALVEVDGLLPMLPEQRHISIRGVGFQVIEARRPDEVLRQDVGRIGERAAGAIASTPPIDIVLGPVNVFPDALILEVHDAGALAALRERIAAATDLADTFGYEAPEFLPHITLAGFGSTGVAAPLRERLPALRHHPAAEAALGRVEFARWWFTGVEPDAEPELEILRSYRLRG